MSSAIPRLLLVSPRPPRADGQGDQRRAYVALTALSLDWEIEVVSWLPDVGQAHVRPWRAAPTTLLRAAALATVQPFQVAYFQSFIPGSVIRMLRSGGLVLYITDRAVPRSAGRPYVIDFIDDLGGAAARRAASESALLAWFWRWESWRLRRLDRRLAKQASLSLAVSQQDASAIDPAVKVIRHAIATRSMPDSGRKVAFTGNLFFHPNLEAANWICDSLAPKLRALGIDPADIIVAGRRPPQALRDKALLAGIDLRADVANLTEVFEEAAVFISPVVYGSGVQSKVLDAVGAGRACVLTTFTNHAFGFRDGESALICDRTPNAFAQAILALLKDPGRRRELTTRAREHLVDYTDEAVGAAWRENLDEVRRSFPHFGYRREGDEAV